MAVSKKFYEAASKDEALRAELEQAALEALGDLLEERGLGQEAAKVLEAAATKVAEAHGFVPDTSEALDLDELDAVAGGVCACPGVGGGTGNGKQCGCVIGGKGHGDGPNAHNCICLVGGGGQDD